MKGINGENALKGNLGDICKYQNFNNRILDEHGEEIGLDYAEEDGEGKNRIQRMLCMNQNGPLGVKQYAI